MGKKRNVKKGKKCEKMDLSIFSPMFSLFDFPFFRCFSPFYFAFAFFFYFADLLFGFTIFVAFVSVFSSLLILRIRYGLVNITIIGLKACR